MRAALALDKAIRRNKLDEALINGTKLDDSMFDSDDEDETPVKAEEAKPETDQSLWVHEFSPSRYTGGYMKS